ncbi:MAG: efflux RND transporter periplasmic adaptor subunit [Bacteroidetes bacterium]|nr:efflux RND transporter periplasmic adaptor subunit [Bacteroidota bacterium]
MKNILKISTMILLLLLVVSCGKNTSKQNLENINSEDHKEEGEHEGEESNKISLQLTQMKVMDVELGEIQQINLGTSLKVNGQLELPPQKKASVSAIIGGRVQSVTVIEGDFVKKGQILARLNNPEFITMQRDYLSAKSNLSFFEKDYLRKKELLKDGITSARAFQESEAIYFEGKAELSATRATLQLMGINFSTLENGKITSAIPVIAPIKGYIQKIEINIGKSIVPEQEMFEIVDNEHLHIGLKVFEKDIDKTKVGQKITFALTTKPDKIYEAEIFALGRAFDMNTRAVKVHAKITGTHESLLTGMFVEARIIIDSKNVDALPDGAFVHENGLDYIFILKKKNENDVEFEKIQINKGISDLGYSEVVFIKPISENTVVVIKGAYYVNAELNKGEFEEHGH